MVTEGTPPQDERDEEDREIQERLALPLLIPLTVFLFAVLVIYGLSRIYLELDQWRYKDVHMATPLAIGIALLILLISSFMATRRTLPRALVPMVLLFAAAGLTGGSIWAAVHSDKPVESAAAKPSPTAASQTPGVVGGIEVTLVDPKFAVNVTPAETAAGSVTFNATNGGSIPHNLRVVKTGLAPGSLPVDSATFAVDEKQVEVVGKLTEFDPGTTQKLTVTLQAGSYVLFCNVPTHYQSGMHAAFTVK